jgi:hypothetical protein
LPELWQIAEDGDGHRVPRPGYHENGDKSDGVKSCWMVRENPETQRSTEQHQQAQRQNRVTNSDLSERDNQYNQGGDGDYSYRCS